MSRHKILLLISAIAFNMMLNVSCKKSSINNTQAPTTPTPPVTVPPVIQTSGNSTGIGNGVNLQPSYYNNGNPSFAWDIMKQQVKIKTVRIEIEPDKVLQAKTWIEQARLNGFEVIATYHKYLALGSDSEAELMAAANWWKINYAQLRASGAFTLNLMNEWGSHNLTGSEFARIYNNAIAEVRTVYNGRIIIDIPGYGQETTVATAAALGTNGMTKLIDTAYILSAHIYPGGYNQAKNRFMNASDIDELSSSNKPCIIGDFGSIGGTGADWSAIVDRARVKNFTLLAWCWNGDGGQMNMIAPSWAVSPAATSFTLSSYFGIVYEKL